MLKLLNKEHKDFSDEFLVLMGLIGDCLYASQLVINKAARTCDLHGLKDCFFQQNRKRVQNCIDAFDSLAKNLNVFDPWFDKVNQGRVDYLNCIHKNANDIVRLILLFYSRTDNHCDREPIFDAIRSFPLDSADDYAAIEDYFKFKL